MALLPLLLSTYALVVVHHSNNSASVTVPCSSNCSEDRPDVLVIVSLVD